MNSLTGKPQNGLQPGPSPVRILQHLRLVNDGHLRVHAKLSGAVHFFYRAGKMMCADPVVILFSCRHGTFYSL